MKRTFLALAVLAAAGALAGTARGDGLPVPVDVSSSGVTGTGADGDVRFVTVPVRGGTLVARVQQEGGRIGGTRFLADRFTIPAVALDGTADGLSADGRTLVLIRPRATFPQRLTRLAILDAERLRVRARVTLRGDFSFDAISPTGSWMYLVQYLSERDPTRYAVRVYDLRAGRLLPEPVVDPTEPEERMGGYPVARVWSPDGRWAYTLYDGAGKEPFVHALDTSGRTARCIDLEALAGRNDLQDLRLRLGGDGATLAVRDAAGVVALIDTETFRVREPLGSAAPAAPPAAKEFPWALVSAPAAGVLLVLVAVAALRLRRRLSPAAPRGT